MQRHSLVTTALVCFIVVAASFARERKKSVAYSHGETLCQEDQDHIPRIRLRLSQTSPCKGGVPYPYLEIDITELHIPVHKRITIGVENWATRCLKANEACEQSLSGMVVFDHFKKNTGKTICPSDGYYELRFRSSQESGHFKVDCRPAYPSPYVEIALP